MKNLKHPIQKQLFSTPKTQLLLLILVFGTTVASAASWQLKPYSYGTDYWASGTQNGRHPIYNLTWSGSYSASVQSPVLTNYRISADVNTAASTHAACENSPLYGGVTNHSEAFGEVYGTWRWDGTNQSPSTNLHLIITSSGTLQGSCFADMNWPITSKVKTYATSESNGSVNWSEVDGIAIASAQVDFPTYHHLPSSTNVWASAYGYDSDVLWGVTSQMQITPPNPPLTDGSLHFSWDLDASYTIEFDDYYTTSAGLQEIRVDLWSWSLAEDSIRIESSYVGGLWADAAATSSGSLSVEFSP